MIAALKRLWLGLLLMALASAALLFSDAGKRETADTALRKQVKVAIVQHASQPIIDDGVRGMLDALGAAGYVDGKTMSVRQFNPQGDLPTANTIAKEIANGGYDLLLTASTPSLQTVANANRDTKTRHVFGLVTDPVVAGVGITGAKPEQHPPWMAGYGTMQPVRESFVLARQLFPDLKRVGVVWNPAEANAEAQLKLARTVCGELGIELIEANAESSAGVLEAAASVVARDAQAIWVPGDVTVLTAVDSVVAAAKRGNIPVFTVIPGSADKGTLFDIGANYYEVGVIAGELAAKVLDGTDPRTIAVEHVMPEKLTINAHALEGLRDPWTLPPEVVRRAEASGAVAAGKPAEATKPSLRQVRLDLLEYIDVLDVEDAERGIRAGLTDAGLVEDRDIHLTVRNAQGDMPTLTALVGAALADHSDMLLTLSTPTLQAAIQHGGKLPIVFTFLADAVAAGAGKNANDHLPNVTGVPTGSAQHELLQLVRDCLPNARRIGSLFAPAEVNSEWNKLQLEQLAPQYGFELVTVPVNSTAEASDATLSLLSKGVDAVTQIPGNLTSSAFASITQPAKRAKLPVFGFLSSDFGNGAVAVVARDFYDGGHSAGLMAARIVRGENPATIPWEPLKGAKVMINLDVAKAVGLPIPPAVLEKAAKVVGN